MNTFTLEQYLERPNSVQNLIKTLRMEELEAACALADHVTSKSFYSDSMSRSASFYKSCERQIINQHIDAGLFEKNIIDNADTYFELKQKDCARAVAILPTVNDYEKRWKLAYFDERGPIFHETFDTRKEAVCSALKAGYLEVCDGHMDKLSSTLTWKKGSHITEMLRLGLDPHKELELAKAGDRNASKYGIQLVSIINEMECLAA